MFRLEQTGIDHEQTKKSEERDPAVVTAPGVKGKKKKKKQVKVTT